MHATTHDGFDSVRPPVPVVARNAPRLRNLCDVRRKRVFLVPAAQLQMHRPTCCIHPMRKVAVQNFRISGGHVFCFDSAPGRGVQ